MGSLICNLVRRLLMVLCGVLLMVEFASSQSLDEGSLDEGSLEEFQQRFSEPQLVAIGKRVHAAFAFDYSNFAIVEGEEALVIIDSGWFPDRARAALLAYRERSKSNKPVAAMVYTHVHGDHTGGASVFVENATDDLRVFGPEGWQARRKYVLSSQFHMIYRRAFEQMGMLLDAGDSGTLGAGIGPAPRPTKGGPFIAPTDTVRDELDATVAGVRLRMIKSAGDIPSHMMIWLPDDKVLFCGDTLGGTLPFIATPRYEPGREPYGFVESLERARKLEPQFVVPGHGRLLNGAEDVHGVLTANIDIIRFLTDQVERRTSKGHSPDRIIEDLRIPRALAQHPDLQPHYHRLDWIVRGLALKQAGFVGDVLDLCRLTDRQEAVRFVELLGGVDATVKHASEALLNEPRWAARLATMANLASPESEEACEVRAKALRKIALTTRSASERNYLLTALLHEAGEQDWDETLGAAAVRVAKTRSTRELLRDLRTRFRSEDAAGAEVIVEFDVDDELHWLEVRRGSLRYHSSEPDDVDGRIALKRDVLDQLWGRQLTWQGALDRDELSADENGQRLVGWLE